MIGLLSMAIVFAFPAVALLALRGGGTRRLALTTAIAVAIIVASALALSSSRFGNALAADQRYTSITVRVVALLLLTAGLPVIAAATALGVFAHRSLHPGVRYAIAVVGSLCGWGIGIVASFAMMWS